MRRDSATLRVSHAVDVQNMGLKNKSISTSFKSDLMSRASTLTAGLTTHWLTLNLLNPVILSQRTLRLRRSRKYTGWSA